MNVQGLFATLIPVFFVLLLGYLAGRSHSFLPEQATGLSKLALGFALPASLFVGMSSLAKPLLLAQWKLALLLIALHPLLLFVSYAGFRRIGHFSATRSTLYALVLATSATPVFGASVLSPLLGVTSIGTVGLVSLAINLTVPAAVVLLEVAGASRPKPEPPSTPHANSSLHPLRRGITSGFRSPLLWAPVLGVMVVLLGWDLPTILRNSLNFIGSATSGVAVFAVGLTLAAHPVVFSRPVAWGALGRITIQTALLLLGSRVLHLTGPFVREAIVCCSFPLSTVTVLLAAKYGEAESETASMLCLSTLALIITVPLAVYLSR